MGNNGARGGRGLVIEGGYIMLGISTRGEAVHLIFVCFRVCILSNQWCVIEFCGQVWKLERVR